MDIRVTVRGVEDKAALRGIAEEKVAAALQRFQERILKVNVRLEDVAGSSKHGVDKLCRIEVRCRPGGEVIIHELGDDLHAVLAIALDRLKAAVSRTAGKFKRGVGAG